MTNYNHSAHNRAVHNRGGTSLVELALAIVLIALLTSLTSTGFTSARDILAVRAARDEIIASSARTRAFAVSHGGANLLVDVTAGTLRITTRDHAVDETSAVSASLGVRMQFDGAHPPTSAVIPYDALGIGRLANRTISIHRDRADGGVTFSAYGRPRAW